MTAKRTPARNDIGKRLAANRRAQQITLVDLAERTGISRNAILKMEHGDNTTINTVVAVAHGLGQDVVIELVQPTRPETRLSLDEIERMVHSLRAAMEEYHGDSAD